MTLIGGALMATAILLLWLVYPRGGQERRIMQLPGTWFVVPLVILLCFGSGAAVVYSFLGK
jgi:hypothetical protein